jgi:predicted secreted hydrolase
VWVEDWSAEGVGAAAGRVRLRAADGPVAIDLLLDPVKPAVLHGDAGFSRKGPEPGNASFYYSYTRLDARGTIITATGARTVTGLAWMDHEWSTSALAADQVGWDWFSLQLDDGRELMGFRIRREDGSIEAASSGTLVLSDGTVRRLDRDAFAVTPLGRWTSPRTGAVYPSRWRVRVPNAGLELVVEPLVEDQEMRTSFVYWEGAVDVRGASSGRPVRGRGYVELTGYGRSMQGVF